MAKPIVIILILLLSVLVYKYINTPKYKLAFYTCFYGTNTNDAFKIPEVPSSKYDCYYFTNNTEIIKKLKATRWIPIFDNKPVTTNITESCMYGKYVKVLPSQVEQLKGYDYTCFLDSKLDKVSEHFVEDFIYKHFIKNDYALLIREHTLIKEANIWNEYNESMLQERYVKQKEQILRYIHKQMKKGLKEDTKQHSQCGFLIRNMRHPLISELDTTWYDHIQECGIQDQISFFFVKQVYEPHILIFKEIPFV